MRHILIDPVSAHYLGNKLFDHEDPILNRDNTLEPGIKLKDKLMSQGVQMHTVDVAIAKGIRGDYWNMGNLQSPYMDAKYEEMFDTRNLMLFEPPVVKPRLYRTIYRHVANFDYIYVHSTDIIAPYLDAAHMGKVRHFRWPIQAFTPEKSGFDLPKNKLICCVIGIHHPRNKFAELYRFRTKWIAKLSNFDEFDLFGMGWNWPGIRTGCWPTYLLNRHKLLRRYQGKLDRKTDIMPKYDFALCVENMRCNGYITEKIFDCFFSGNIPLYYGAPNVVSFIPQNCFIPLEQFSIGADLINFLNNMSYNERARYRENIRDFLNSKKFKPFQNALEFAMIN